jgi:hypothetical protein
MNQRVSVGGLGLPILSSVRKHWARHSSISAFNLIPASPWPAPHFLVQ